MSLLRIFRPKAKGFGYKPDPHDKDRLSSLLSLSSTPPKEFSLEHLLDRIHDQGSSSSCVGQAAAAGLHLALAYRGIKHPYPSSRWLYSVGRAYVGDEKIDDGAYIRFVLKALQKLGFCSEEEMPWDLSKINKTPSGLAYLRAHANRGVKGYYRIQELLVERRFLIAKQAVASGRPVLFGMNVDKAFTESEGPSVIGLQGKKFGGHALLMLGYTSDKARVLNSWGAWRDGGLCYMDEGAMSGWRDMWVLDPVGG